MKCHFAPTAMCHSDVGSAPSLAVRNHGKANIQIAASQAADLRAGIDTPGVRAHDAIETGSPVIRRACATGNYKGLLKIAVYGGIGWQSGAQSYSNEIQIVAK
ncbi:hypothetical protein PTKU15_24880 [Paraburkholderia terrae]|nr:hypothetical protein PTKU15_24880 [Paraburkholderia terrae]